MSIPEYDPHIHLASNILTKQFNKIAIFPNYDISNILNSYEIGHPSQLAFSEPFQVLSQEGISVLRNIINLYKKDITTFGVGDRVPMSIRSLGYKCKWISDFNECKILTNYLSILAGKELVAHTFKSSYSHVNIGAISDDKPVDQWHCDSVPFVLVILMSDMTGASGGELQVLKKERNDGFKTLLERRTEDINKHTLTVKYPAIGSAIFMQGSKMLHHVTPVKRAKEPRITVVNSYMPVDPNIPDETRLAIFKNEPDVCYYEYAKHKASIAISKFKQLIETKPKNNGKYYSNEFDKIISDLQENKSVLDGTINDGHVDGLFINEKFLSKI